MKKWLSSGQMIDQLNPGEIAIDNNGFKVSYDSKGILRLYNVEEEIDDQGIKYYISSEDRNCKWYILDDPYVSFDKVITALNEGKAATLVLKDHRKIEFNKSNLETHFKGLTVKDLTEGRWYIHQ